MPEHVENLGGLREYTIGKQECVEEINAEKAQVDESLQ